jgi:hypothetical protein
MRSGQALVSGSAAFYLRKTQFQNGTLYRELRLRSTDFA